MVEVMIATRVNAADSSGEAVDVLFGLVENSPVIICVKDLQCRYVTANTRFEGLFRKTREEISGKTDYDLFPKPVADCLRAHDRSVLESGAPLECDEIIPLDDGPHTYFVTKFLVHDSSRQPSALAVIAIDVTERKRAESSGRKRAEETLQTKEALFRSLIENTSDIVTVLDSHGRVRYSSPALERVLGYSMTERTSLSGFDLVHPDDLLSVREAFARGLETPGSVTKAEVRLRHRDGSWRFLDCIGKNLMDEPVIGGYVITSRDITDRKAVEAALRDSEKALKHSEAQLRHLTAGLIKAQEEERRRISLELHDDLNQRLAMLAVEVESLEQNLPSSPDAIRQRLRDLRKRADGVSDDMRRTARRLHPSILEHLGLVSALRAFCSDVEGTEKRKIRFSHREVPNPMPLDIALCLYRIAQEGIRNVIRHAGPTEAAINLSHKGGQIHLSIADNGVGFRRNPAKSTRGLGLVGIEERARLVNGTVSIWSCPGSGTKIDVRIPFREEQK